MRAGRSGAIWTISLFVLFAGRVAGGQSIALARDCVPAQINTTPGSVWFDERPMTFRAATMSQRQPGVPAGYLQLADSIGARFARRARGLSDADRQAVERRLAWMREDMAGARRPAAVFGITPNATDNAFVIFPRSIDSIVITVSQGQQERRALCWAMLEAQDLSSDFSRADREAFAEFLEQRVRRWDNFHEHGYSMLPFELLVNSWLGERWGPLRRPPLEPPKEQLIFLHPTIALEIPVNDISWSVHGRDALVVEPLGYLRYNAERTNFRGISAAASLTEGEGPAWGGVVHFGKLLHIGYLYRPDPSDDRREHVVGISADLLKAVLGRGRVFRAEVDTLRQRIAECRTGAAACLSVVTNR
jgi:hypothetical protein